MSRRLEKLIEQKAWETLTDYGYNDAHLLEQLTESVLERLDEQRQNINEFFDWPLPDPPNAPPGGSWTIDPATGNIIYIVMGRGGYMIYDLNGKVVAGPLAGGANWLESPFYKWFKNRRKLGRQRDGKNPYGPDNPRYDDLSPRKSRPGFRPGGMGPNSYGPDNPRYDGISSI